MSKPAKPIKSIKDAKDALVHLGAQSLWNAHVEDWQPPSHIESVNEKHEKHENSVHLQASALDFSCNSSFSCAWNEPPVLPETALYGPAGEIVRRILPCTEADPAALYAQLLTGLGNLIGPSAYFVADGSRHHANLFAIICGRTAKARKGTSWSQVRNVLEAVDAIWFSMRVKSGIVSGEGITQVFEDNADKRLLLLETEFAQVLQVMKREGCTVSVLLRQAWDGQTIAVLRRKDAIEVHGAHISLIGHVTLPELRKLLASVEMSNGLANRCLWVHADRSKLLPDGGIKPDTADLIEELSDAVNTAQTRGEVHRDDEARALWGEIYAQLSEPHPGKVGEILSRAEAQVMRIALLLALLDRSAFIGKRHLEAAMSFWRYCEASAAHIFVETPTNPKAAKIWQALENSPLTMTQVHELFGRNASKQEIDTALAELAPRIVIETGGAGGGKTIRSKQVKPCTGESREPGATPKKVASSGQEGVALG